VGKFADTTASRVPAGFEFAEPLRELLIWIEEHGQVDSDDEGELYGSLHADGSVGTEISVRGFTPAETSSYVQSWFGKIDDDPSQWLWPFARTGGDGSMAALWRTPDNTTQIVHLGSGSGSILTCVLAENAVDFLRLLAIGYPEICWNEEFAQPPRSSEEHTGVNVAFQEWVRSTYRTTIPATALEIVAHPAEVGDDDTLDPFCRLVNRLTA
jgi:hypothetical protein